MKTNVFSLVFVCGVLMSLNTIAHDGQPGKSTGTLKKTRPAIEKYPIQSTEDLLLTPEITWAFRTQIVEAVTRSDVPLILQNNINWLKERYSFMFATPNTKNSRKQNNLARLFAEKKFKSHEDFKTFEESVATFVKKTRRAEALVEQLKVSQRTEPQKFFDTYKELIEIDRSHEAFPFEGLVDLKVFELKRRCQVSLGV